MCIFLTLFTSEISIAVQAKQTVSRLQHYWYYTSVVFSRGMVISYLEQQACGISQFSFFIFFAIFFKATLGSQTAIWIKAQHIGGKPSFNNLQIAVGEYHLVRRKRLSEWLCSWKSDKICSRNNKKKFLSGLGASRWIERNVVSTVLNMLHHYWFCKGIILCRIR